MRVVLVGIGSLGDVTPHVALGAELRDHGHQVRIVGLAPYADAAAAVGLPYIPVAASTSALWPDGPVRRRLILMQPGLMYLAMLRRLRTAAKRVNEALLATVQPGDVVVSGLVTAGACALLAQHCGVRTVPILFAPLLPADSPASSALAPRLGSARAALAGSHAMWSLSQGLAFAHTADMAARLGAGNPDLAPLGEGPVLMATSPTLTPRSAHWPDRVHQTGWIAPAPAVNGSALPPDLDAFMTANPEPVLMTFGTSPVVDPRRDASLFLAAAARAGRPAVLQTNALPFGALGDYAFNAPHVPHAVLMPRVKGVVHHGGAGTTYAALAAGRPSAIVPHLGDQPYYARRVHALGVGPRGIPRWRLTERILTEMVNAVCTGASAAGYAERAARVARQLGRENGRAEAARQVVAVSAS